MMNRNIMQRQMCAKGGAAFPELSGDGRVTRKDILMGRGVPMQMGGEPQMAELQAQAMAQGVGSMMPPPPAMPPAQGPMGNEEVMDPAVVEGMLIQAQENLGNIDEAEDYETVINTIRGEDAPISARYEELAEIVGEEDAAQTPESVLTLVQPAIVMGAVDQGIGGLAAEEMTAPVEGAMAQGIMSTVAPPPPPAAPGPEMDPAMMGAGQQPPVNFNQGGVVRPVVRMQEGGDPIAQAGRLGELYAQKVPLYQSIMGDQSAALEEQKKMTQAQVLFDIANTALAFSGPMEGERKGLSHAEPLALATQKTQLLPTIGARAGELLKSKQAATGKEQQMKLSALGAAETGLAAESKAAADLAKQKLIGSQDLAKLELGDKLDTARQIAVEKLKQTGASTLENQKPSTRVALEDVLQDNKTAIENLRQSGSRANIVLADKLEKENIELRGNIELGKMDVANEYDLAKMDKSHEQATALNTTNNALKEKLSEMDRELAERRLALDAKKAEVAEAQGNRKLELQEEANIMQADVNAFEMNYKTDKLALEEAAARLTRLGSNTEARITTLLSDPERLAAYAAGTLSPPDTLEMNQAIAYYNAPKSVWSEEKKAYVLQPGNPLSNELMSSIRIRQENKLAIPNIKLDKTETGQPKAKPEIVSEIMSGVTDVSPAFGTEGALKSIANTLAEVVFLGAPYKPEKEAIEGVNALNTKFVQVFQRSAELRDSVMQLNLLKDLTPTPTSVFTGPEAAGAKVKRLLGMIDEAESALQTKLSDPDTPLTSKQVSEARGYLTDLAQLRAGYRVFDNAYKQVSNTKVNKLRGVLGLGKKN